MDEVITEKDKNLAITLAEDVAGILEPAQSGDAELVRAAVDFTTEISPEQNKVLVLYEMLSEDMDVNPLARKKLKIMAAAFRERQKYFNTKMYIMDIIRSMSWRHFVESGYITGNVSKNESKMG
jgi:hypothetical protein